MDYKSEIVKKIHEMAKYYSAHRVFRDWMEFCYQIDRVKERLRK